MRKIWAYQLIIIGLIAILGLAMSLAGAPTTPTIFVTPATRIGDLDPYPGSVYMPKIDVSDVPAPGLWGYEFFLKFDPNVLGAPPVIPLVNMNFTDTGSTAWTTGSEGTGTASNGYDTGDGNPSPGSGAPSYYHRATSTADASASLYFQTEQNFTLGLPLKPNGNGFYTAWTNDWNYWDDMPADGDLSYVSTNVDAAKETSTLEDPPVGENRSIEYVRVYIRAKDTSTTGDDKIRIMIRSRDTDYFAPSAKDINPTTTYTTYSYTWEGNHPGGGAWTWDDIQNLQVGVQYIKVSGTATTVRVTQIYVDVSSWPGLPVWVGLSYSYKVTGNSIAATGNDFWIEVQKPDGTAPTLIEITSFTAATPWTYVITEAPSSRFDAPGTYKFRLMNSLTTAASGTANYVQFNWDDVGVKISPISIREGPFLKQGGSTDFLMISMNETTLYVSNTLVGTPYGTAFPVTGSGTLVNATFLVDYGASQLDLAGTKLITLGDPPSYPPIEISHSVQDGFFRNKLYGDVNGDKEVDTSDLDDLSQAYGSDSTKPNWNLECDFRGDGEVNIIDLFDLGKGYGKTA